MILPHVVRFNTHGPEVARAYAELACSAQIGPSQTPEVASESLAHRLEQLLDLAAMPRCLKDFGVGDKDIPRLAKEAAGQWTAQFNPRSVTAADFERIYANTLAQ
jgi:alcohol dehydrogenase class IV